MVSALNKLPVGSLRGGGGWNPTKALGPGRFIATSGRALLANPLSLMEETKAWEGGGGSGQDPATHGPGFPPDRGTPTRGGSQGADGYRWAWDPCSMGSPHTGSPKKKGEKYRHFKLFPAFGRAQKGRRGGERGHPSGGGVTDLKEQPGVTLGSQRAL